MTVVPAGVDDSDLALLTDLYELTMIQSYWREGLTEEAVFSLLVRRLPQSRNYILACGLDTVLDYFEMLRFTQSSLAYLASIDHFSPDFLRWLEDFRFDGDVYAMPEGTPVFANEPLLEVVAPLPQAQLVEAFVLNQMHLQTLLASKAARVVHAARGRPVIDFGLRRMHGTDAAVKGARAFFIGGVAATSNVLAGQIYGLPVSGTMAHSYVQAHEHELDAFRAFAEMYPEAILLVDTYDSLEGVRRVIELGRELGARFRVRGVRLDSGDLATLSVDARRMLDDAGLRDVHVFASGGLDEHEISVLIEDGAPIDGFGVGSAMGVSDDAPALDIAYKLTAYAGRGRLKRSPGKRILPGRKQVFRFDEGGCAIGDLIARSDEGLDGRPLMRKVMERGQRLPEGREELTTIRARASAEMAALPPHVQALAPANPPFSIEISGALLRDREQVEAAVTR